jgi:hypothetical protein
MLDHSCREKYEREQREDEREQRESMRESSGRG